MGRSVLLVGGDLAGGGGVNRVIRDLSTIFTDRLGLRVTVLALTEGEPTYPFSPAVEIERHPGKTSSRAFWGLMREIRRRDFDHVIGFWHWDNIRIASAFGPFSKAPILMEHTSWYHAPLRTRLARAVTYRAARAVCVLNPAERRHYRKFLPNVVVMPNPVPELDAPEGVPREKLILAVGHLIERKNQGDAIEAFAASTLAQDGWRLAIIGSGPDEERLRDLIRTHGLGSCVEIVPPTKEIDGWYARASMTVVTSKIEVFSLALAEAMRSGVVPLAYAADGPAYILEDNPDLLVPIGDTETLGTRLREVARSGTLATRGEAMRQVVDRRFSEAVVAEKWRALLGL